jgi:L-threonylcarbamoyladenylate synthase
MNTLMLKVDPDKPDAAKIWVAAEIIQRGGLVAFPPETVTWLGAEWVERPPGASAI